MWFVLFLPPLWLLIGYLNDLPGNVHDDEPGINGLVSWLALAVHVPGAILVSTVSPLWSLAWGLFAGVSLARRLCASGYWAIPLRVSELVSEVRHSVPYGLLALTAATVVGIASPFLRLPSLLGSVQDLAGLAVGAVCIAVLGYAGAIHTRRESAHFTRRARAIDAVAAVFGVTRSLLEEQAPFAFGADGTISLVPAPPAVAAKLLDRTSIEQRVAEILPHLTLHPSSTAAGIYLVPVDDAAQARRQALATSGGLLAGSVEAPSGEPAPQALILGPEDL